MSAAADHEAEPSLDSAISGAMVEPYATFYQHDRTTATDITDINDMIVVCVLENILTTGEDALAAEGAGGEVIDARVAFQTDTEDEFTAQLEGLSSRHVTAFLSVNQAIPGVAYELLFLDATPLTTHRSQRGVRIEPGACPRRRRCARRRSADVAGGWRKRRHG